MHPEQFADDTNMEHLPYDNRLREAQVVEAQEHVAQRMDALSLEIPKTRMDGVLSNLI